MPVGKWRHLRVEDMTATYKSKLEGGNIGVALGDVSNGICAIDIDNDKHVEPFLAANPALAGTFQTHGSRGRVFWIRIKGHCPKTHKLKTTAGEFRSTGSYSVASGIHPNGNPYQWVVKKPVVEIAFDSIKWPDAPAQASQNLPKGDSAKGDITKGCPPYNCYGSNGVVGVVVGMDLSEKLKSQIDQAVGLGADSTTRNNEASFNACLALIRILDVESLAGLLPAARRYFAERWFERLRDSGRVNPAKSKTHYLNDLFTSIKNAKRQATMENKKNPIPQAWMLAQTEPLPAEAEAFAGDETMQRLIALCYQLHLLSGKGEWYLARNKVGELMRLDDTAKRNLSENFNVLVQLGILKIVKPHEKGERKATTYRYIEQGH